MAVTAELAIERRGVTRDVIRWSQLSDAGHWWLHLGLTRWQWVIVHGLKERQSTALLRRQPGLHCSLACFVPSSTQN